jgi:16S rRNA (cytosine1402-N4)-methyltransferase
MKKKTQTKINKFDKTKSDRTEYDYHLPVLLNEATNYLFNEIFNKDINSIYIDGTLGGGGHAAIIMQRINNRGKLFAFDKDKSAIERAKNKFEEEINSSSPSLLLFNQSFSKAYSICEEMGVSANGILLDLGVSSKQLDSEQGGISYRVNSALDMRFDSEQKNNIKYCANNSNSTTAKEILNTMSEDELTALFRKYGEEPRSRVIARRIIEIRRVKTLETTFELRFIIEECTPKIHHFKTLSRIFQAIRIKVNNELDELNTTLNNIINVLKPGGRIVVISYHSLEDRIVKQFFKEKSLNPKKNKYAIKNKELNTNNTIIVPNLKILTPKPIIPSEYEIKSNPRARSAKMRVAEIILSEPGFSQDLKDYQDCL